MDEEQFDQLVRNLGDNTSRPSRRGVLGVLAGALVGLGLGEVVAERHRRQAGKRHRRKVQASALNRGECNKLCARLFSSGQARAECIRQGAEGQGPCSCGKRCGSEATCCDKANFDCCDGACTNLRTGGRCGSCAITCSGEVNIGGSNDGDNTAAVTCCGGNCRLADGEPCNPADGQLSCCNTGGCIPETGSSTSSTGYRCACQSPNTCTSDDNCCGSDVCHTCVETPFCVQFRSLGTGACCTRNEECSQNCGPYGRCCDTSVPSGQPGACCNSDTQCSSGFFCSDSGTCQQQS